MFGTEEHPPISKFRVFYSDKENIFFVPERNKIKDHIFFAGGWHNLVEICNCQIILYFYWWYK